MKQNEKSKLKLNLLMYKAKGRPADRSVFSTGPVSGHYRALQHSATAPARYKISLDFNFCFKPRLGRS